MSSIRKILFVLSVFCEQSYSQITNSYYNELISKGYLYNKSDVCYYSEQDQHLVDHVMREGMPPEKLKLQYERETLRYVDFLLRLGNNLTEDQQSLVETLLEQDYEQVASADLLRAAFYLWKKENKLGYKKVEDLVNAYECKDFEGSFGMFAELHDKICIIRKLNIKNKVNGFTDKNNVLDKFLSKFFPLVEKSKIASLRGDGRLKVEFVVGEGAENLIRENEKK